jgi:hypothetical protein
MTIQIHFIHHKINKWFSSYLQTLFKLPPTVILITVRLKELILWVVLRLRHGPK